MNSDRLLLATLTIVYIIAALYLVLSLPTLRPRGHPSNSKDRESAPLFYRFPRPGDDTPGPRGGLRLARDCDVERVFCVDDCSFLCLDGERYRCAGNACVPFAPRKRGRRRGFDRGAGRGRACVMGVEVLSKADGGSGVPQRKCVCSDPTWFGGERCDMPEPDLCEHGVLLFGKDETSKCVCHPPYRLVWDDYRKPHCLEKHWRRFFPRHDRT